jgi:CheY-like chemotaxis protein
LQKNLQRGADLTKQLLTFTRGAEGETMPISVSALIFEAVKAIQETFPRSINIVMKVDPEIHPVIGDSTKLHQVLMNLCINARDAMPYGGTLTITGKDAFLDECFAKSYIDAKVGHYVCITVADNGTGMSKEVKEKLFEPFFTTKKLGEGTGLGLFTARSIIKSLGGFMTVHSELGEGTTFRIYLPRGEQENNTQEKTEVVGFPQGSGQAVLVVDDEELIRIMAAAALENNGYKTLVAGDGVEALAVYSRNKDTVKLVLLDMSMPLMDGEATMRALKKINPGIKIIGMSGLVEDGKYKNTLNMANAFISKPFTAERLLKIIANEVKE